MVSRQVQVKFIDLTLKGRQPFLIQYFWDYPPRLRASEYSNLIQERQPEVSPSVWVFSQLHRLHWTEHPLMCLMNFLSYLRPASGHIIFYIVTLRANKEGGKNHNNQLMKFHLNHCDQSFIDKFWQMVTTFVILIILKIFRKQF